LASALYLAYREDSPKVAAIDRFLSFLAEPAARDTLRRHQLVPYAELDDAFARAAAQRRFIAARLADAASLPTAVAAATPAGPASRGGAGPVQGQATGPRVRGARRAAEARPGSRRGTRGRGARAVPSRRRQRAAREPAPGTGREAGFAFRGGGPARREGRGDGELRQCRSRGRDPRRGTGELRQRRRGHEFQREPRQRRLTKAPRRGAGSTGWKPGSARTRRATRSRWLRSTPPACRPCSTRSTPRRRAGARRTASRARAAAS